MTTNEACGSRACVVADKCLYPEDCDNPKPHAPQAPGAYSLKPGESGHAPIIGAGGTGKAPAPTEAAWPEEVRLAQDIVSSYEISNAALVSDQTKNEYADELADALELQKTAIYHGAVPVALAFLKLARVGALKRPLDRDRLSIAMINAPRGEIGIRESFRLADALIAADAKGELS